VGLRTILAPQVGTANKAAVISPAASQNPYFFFVILFVSYL